MPARTQHPITAGNPPVFPIACWALGLVAFSQLLVAGVALSKRFEESRVVRVVEKEVPRLIAVRIPSANADAVESGVVVRPPAPAPAETSTPPPTPLEAPAIADPRAERLVDQARRARVAGDMGRAILKLEEALLQSPDDPSVFYELGLAHEQMGVFDTASAYYEKVFQLGVSGAGSLYEIAAAKLRDGFEQPGDMLGKLALGRVRIFNDPNHEGGEQVILSIPVQKAPGAEVETGEIEVSVIFFNRNAKGEILQLEEKSWVTQQWVSLPFDWAGGEETLRMNYVIPRQDGVTSHLFGALSYYGKVVSLLYKGEVLDVQAWPRDLAARIPQAPVAAPDDYRLPEFFDPDSLPPDFDPENPLLPALPSY
jgi:tetratricopeptide (TPR) repeat protein